jgi:23S rRNA (adenine2030-N6)-methyltransferase
MLSYQHQYHAGNFADVHKHLCLRLLFESLLRKDKPFCYVDCHAGSAGYDLDSPEARRTGEFLDGIGRLWPPGAGRPPAALATYLASVAAVNPDGELRYYPGSPALAGSWLRPQDKALLIELHPQAQAALKAYFRGDRRVSVHPRDCYEGLPALLPPDIKRGVVLLDPSYEVKDEYLDIAGLALAAHRRWSNGIYALWYPLLPAGRHLQLLATLAGSDLPEILVTELTVTAAGSDRGMYGSGLAIINPPWQLDAQLVSLLPWLAETLAPGSGHWQLSWLTGDQAAP